MRNILITGGTGFLGCHLARRLLKENYKVTLFDIAPLDAKDLIGKVSVIKGDIRDKNEITKALKGQDFVIHAAAALPIQFTKEAIFSVNVNGTKNVLNSALNPLYGQPPLFHCLHVQNGQPRLLFLPSSDKRWQYLYEH